MQDNFWNNFEKNNLGEYSDFFVQCDTLVLSNIFKSFREMGVKTFRVQSFLL